MKKIKIKGNLDIQHELNEALRNCLNRLKIEVNDEINNDPCLDLDYYELLSKFGSHLELVVKVSKECDGQ